MHVEFERILVCRIPWFVMAAIKVTLRPRTEGTTTCARFPRWDRACDRRRCKLKPHSSIKMSLSRDCVPQFGKSSAYTFRSWIVRSEFICATSIDANLSVIFNSRRPFCTDVVDNITSFSVRRYRGCFSTLSPDYAPRTPRCSPSPVKYLNMFFNEQLLHCRE